MNTIAIPADDPDRLDDFLAGRQSEPEPPEIPEHAFADYHLRHLTPSDLLAGRRNTRYHQSCDDLAAA